MRSPTLENYAALLGDPMFQRFFLNSVIVTVLVVAITMVVSILAAFALARMRFWGSEVLATGVFLTYLVPDTLLFIPLYQIVGGLGLLNSIWGLVLVYPTLTVPFCTWIMIGYFASIPKELDEAALIDGANWTADAVEDLHPGGAARHHRGDDLRLHRVLGAPSSTRPPSSPRRTQMPLTIGVVSAARCAATPSPGGRSWPARCWRRCRRWCVYAFLMDYYIAGLTAGATKG